MNFWIICYVFFHVIIVGVLLFDLVFQYGRIKMIKAPMGQNVNDVWEHDRNKARATKFFTRSLIAFIATGIGEVLSFWFLWMAGTFD